MLLSALLVPGQPLVTPPFLLCTLALSVFLHELKMLRLPAMGARLDDLLQKIGPDRTVQRGHSRAHRLGEPGQHLFELPSRFLD